MTHDELMKALECCVNGDPCKECPVYGCSTCVDSLLETAKNTIERKDEALTTIKQEFASQSEANSNLFAENGLLKEKIKTLETKVENITNVASEYEEEWNQQEAEIENLKALVERYAASARAISLNLSAFCDTNLPYDEMISDASRRASAEIEKLKAEIKKLKAAAEAELDTIHDLGDDYERILKEETQHIREAKIEAAKELGRKLIDNSRRGVIGAADIVDIVFEYVESIGKD